jgi:hypothetical protein
VGQRASGGQDAVCARSQEGSALVHPRQTRHAQRTGAPGRRSRRSGPRGVDERGSAARARRARWWARGSRARDSGYGHGPWSENDTRTPRSDGVMRAMGPGPLGVLGDVAELVHRPRPTCSSEATKTASPLGRPGRGGPPVIRRPGTPLARRPRPHTVPSVAPKQGAGLLGAVLCGSFEAS